MTMKLHDIDDQIREVENRIAVERVALSDAMHDCSNSLKEAATSPKTLLALLGVGYAVGKVLFKEKPAKGRGRQQEDAPVKKAGVLGILTGVAGTALTSRFGWGSVAKWAARRYLARRRAAAEAARHPGIVTPGAFTSPPVSPVSPSRSNYPRTPTGV